MTPIPLPRTIAPIEIELHILPTRPKIPFPSIIKRQRPYTHRSNPHAPNPNHTHPRPRTTIHIHPPQAQTSYHAHRDAYPSRKSKTADRYSNRIMTKGRFFLYRKMLARTRRWSGMGGLGLWRMGWILGRSGFIQRLAAYACLLCITFDPTRNIISLKRRHADKTTTIKPLAPPQPPASGPPCASDPPHP